ncbi:MAG TPA: NADH-quinone oxidoreductase subunit C [candidate division Zixibacteria bacterium]|nr:NADH-quinone oxidoreductase subunit C [candidate division Zixibacteria bacterium]
MTDEQKYAVSEIVKSALGGMVVSIDQPRPNRIYVLVDQKDFPAAAKVVYEQLGGRLATSTALEVRDAVELIYHFMLETEMVLCNLKTLVMKPELKVGSVGAFLPGADWIEREMAEMYGVTFEGHPDPRHLLLPDGWPEGNYPMRKDFPQQPGTESGETKPVVY